MQSFERLTTPARRITPRSMRLARPGSALRSRHGGSKKANLNHGAQANAINCETNAWSPSRLSGPGGFGLPDGSDGSFRPIRQKPQNLRTSLEDEHDNRKHDEQRRRADQRETSLDAELRHRRQQQRSADHPPDAGAHKRGRDGAPLMPFEPRRKRRTNRRRRETRPPDAHSGEDNEHLPALLAEGQRRHGQCQDNDSYIAHSRYGSQMRASAAVREKAIEILGRAREVLFPDGQAPQPVDPTVGRSELGKT
jgi:hypothetical protein